MGRVQCYPDVGANMRSNSWRWVALGAWLGVFVFVAVRLPLFEDTDIQQASMLAPPRRAAPVPVFIPDPPPAEPSHEVPTLVQVSQKNIDLRIDALAREM